MLIAIRTSVLLEVFVAEVIPKTSPLGRWVVPFFFGILVFGWGCMLMHLGGIVAIRVSLLCAISASVSSSSRTTPSVLLTALVSLRFCASWRAVIWSLFGGE